MKKVDSIQKVAIVGAGVMGSGIAQVAAMAGYDVLLYDLNQNALDKAANAINNNLDKGILRGKVSETLKTETLNRLQYSTESNDLVADLILEAIVERKDVKLKLFNQLASINKPTTILASNTSSIPITELAAVTPHPERVVGIHFFNPAHIMKLVEIVSGMQTAPVFADLSFEWANSLGKQAAKVSDAPGFIVNRVARHFYVEGLKVLEEKVADHETIDTLIQNLGFKMGPFRLMDLIGVETNLSVTESMYKLFNYDAKFRPNRIQQQMASAGYHGRKTKKGFYSYE
jgi:3-hydroxybutyryl-CoA dehydrogenase